MIAFHCQTFPHHCLFWEWVLFKLGGEYRYRYRYEYIVEQNRAEICSQLDCERIPGMVWLWICSTVWNRTEWNMSISYFNGS